MQVYPCVILFAFYASFHYFTVVASYNNKGFIIYCPCMGRFGNQADYLLGSLAFAHELDRTLVLPPWPTMLGFVEFDEWFKMNVLLSHQHVVTAGEFMRDIAPEIWPDGQRIGFCYKPPHGNYPETCELKQGSPFSNFWDSLNVDFDSTIFYNMTYSNRDIKLWKERFPADKYSVLAFKGAPASFPVQSNNVQLQQYLWWSDKMVEAASQLVYSLVEDNQYIAVHLRNGVDWENACAHVPGRTSFMSSPQCMGYANDALLTMAMCLPDTQVVLKRLREAVIHTNVTHIYVLTDRYPLLSEIEEGLSDLGVRAVHGDPDLPQYDLIIAAKAQLFIGNCISSFSAFIKRERDHVLNKPTWFFGVELGL